MISEASKEPVFKRSLGKDWDDLATSVKSHYSLIPYSADRVLTKGTMEKVSRSRLAGVFIPFAIFFGALIPRTGRDIPIEVLSHSKPRKAGYYWRRRFYFSEGKPSNFNSTSLYAGPGEILELVRFGLGVRLSLSTSGGGMVMRHLKFVWKIRSLEIRLPIEPLIGRLYVEEMPISENQFSMRLSINHAIFGQTFCYQGTFTVGR